MEYLYTNLPRYITITPRSAFANSVVQSGSVLLFSEDGTTLTAKLPDGSFITVGGGGGTDVSDTTATAATVLAGYDFHLANGTKTTGTIQTVTASQSGNIVTVPAGYIATAQTLTVGTAKAAATYTPTTSDQTITAGQYLTGDQTIKGDANLLAANIVSGVTIFGVTGTASGGATDYYKCATVDTVNLTWTGYKAVFDSATGAYSFESTATSGLTYSVVTPAVGNVYADGALIEAKLFTGIPTDYVVYHPLSSAEASVSGYNCSYSNVTFAQDSSLGETVAVFNGDGRLTISNVAGSPAIAFSIFQKIDEDTGDNHTIVMRDYFGILSTPSYTGVFDFTGGLELEKQYSNTGWHHIYADYANGVTRLFIDGVEAANTTSFTYSYNYTSNVQMGVHFNGFAFPLTGKLKAFRMYNRQLTAAEIAALAAEFTPSAGA